MNLENYIKKSPLYAMMERPHDGPEDVNRPSLFNKAVMGEFFRTFKEISREGSKEFVTQFQNPKTGQAQQFRTLIELDGDIINFIPNPSKLSLELHQQAYRNTWKEHQQKIAIYLATLQQSTNFWINSIFGLIALIPNMFLLKDLYAMILSGKISDEYIQLGIEIGVLMATLYLKEPAKKLIMKLLMKIGKSFM